MHLVVKILLALFILTNLALAGTARLRSAIRLVAIQGWFVGLLPLFLSRDINARLIAIAIINIFVKGVALPSLLLFAARKAKAKFELEPLVSLNVSSVIAFVITIASFALAKTLHINETTASELSSSVAFSTIGIGLFLICARKKAVTQVAGFLTFENGIAIFGSSLLLEHGFIVEFGILLDVFVLVFVLGIAICQINQTFSSIDTDKLNHLGDNHLKHINKKHHNDI